MNNSENLIVSSEIKFDYKADAIPYQCRLSYKMTTTCLMMRMTSRNGGISLAKIHLLSNYLYSEKEREILINYLKGDKNIFIFFRFDALVNKVLEFLIADNMIFQQKNGLYKLTDRGKKYIDLIITDVDILYAEKLFFNSIGNQLTEKKISEIERRIIY
jgi:hypothetical protein